jgi:hypothetical protein
MAYTINIEGYGEGQKKENKLAMALVIVGFLVLAFVFMRKLV